MGRLDRGSLYLESPLCHYKMWQGGFVVRKKHRKGFYTILLTSGKLNEHLHKIDETAFERRELIIKQMKDAQGVIEQLKSDDMMKWVGMVTNICA